MPDVSTFVIGGETISVYDENARTQAAQASSKADAASQTAKEASTTANAASAKVDEIAALSRLEISYSEESKTITITTGNHEG